MGNDKREVAQPEKVRNLQQQGIVLEKSLVIWKERNIGIEIGEKVTYIKKLQREVEILKREKRKGKTTVKHWQKVKRVSGIPIKYTPRGLNKRIFYEASINESDEIFNAKVEEILRILTRSGHKPLLCKRYIKAEMGKGALCDI